MIRENVVTQYMEISCHRLWAPDKETGRNWSETLIRVLSMTIFPMTTAKRNVISHVQLLRSFC